MNCKAPPGKDIPFLIDIHASKRPDSLAVIDGKIALTYADLSQRSTLLAHYLRSLGVRRDDVVGVALPRSGASIVAALAVMKAGGAYLPLDPSHPATRLRLEVADAGVAIVLTSAASVGQAWPASLRNVPIASDGNCAELDGRSEIDARRDLDSTPLEAVILPGDLAYVIYTSGSTGQPKGVEVTHGGLANLAAWHCSAFEVCDSDRASHLSAVSFDAAVWEVWPYLVAGASIHVVDDGVAREPAALRDWLVDKGITVCFASTPLAERLIDLEWPSSSRLRTLLTGADTLHKYPSPALPFTLVNNYGPTETTVVATSGPVAPGGGDRLPSIGRPITNVRIDIVDADGERVPPGTEGEIWIGGAGVARGYRGLPELSAQKFIPDPFDPSANQMVYRTGDRGRFLPDGQLAFLGRIDDQIKIRGFRVEPREIEAALDRHPAIGASAIILHEFADGDQRLFAFVVFVREPVPAVSEIRAFLETQLPQYMLPSSFIALPALPVTHNGKVDRTSLQARALSDALEDDRFVAPRTPIEAQLVQIIQPLLKLDRVSVEDDFYAVGGHSLLGTQIITRVSEAFNVRISLRFLFQSPTIAALAAEIEQLIQNRERAAHEAGQSDMPAAGQPTLEPTFAAQSDRGAAPPAEPSELITLRADGTATPLFYLHGVISGGEGSYSLKLSKYLADDRPIYILPPHGLNGRALPTTIEAMATEYISIIRAARPRGPYVLGGWCNGGLVAFEMARQLREMGETVLNVILIEVYDANHFLRIAVEGIDRLRKLLRIDPRLRSGTIRFLARVPFQLRRLGELSVENILVKKVRGVLSRLAGMSPQTGAVPQEKLLLDFTRVGEAYVARRYNGRITVLLAQDPSSLHKRAAGWKTVAPHVEVRSVPGDHVSCVTEHFSDTVKEFTHALVVDEYAVRLHSDRDLKMVGSVTD